MMYDDPTPEEIEAYIPPDDGVVEDYGQADAMPTVTDTPIAPVAKLNSDTGNAARFAIRYQGKLIHVPDIGWHLYRDGRWMKDEGAEIIRMGMDAALRIGDEAAAIADSDARSALFTHAAKSQSASRINAMIELAKGYMSIPARRLDADPMVLNLVNGTIDLRTGRLRPHDPADYLTKQCRAAYHLDAEAPIFLKFLTRIFSNHPELPEYVIRALGYSLTGSVKEQCLFFAYGCGQNGKTTLFDTMTYVLGDYAGRADRELLADRDGAHPANVADLQGRRMVVMSETKESGRMDESKLKDLVGETTLKARRMYGDFYEFANQTKLWIFGNHKPVLRGTDVGLWRRWRMIPFDAQILPEEKDGDLPTKLRAEADGILALLLTGCREWIERGLQTPKVVMEATQAYRSEMDVLGGFLAECCEVGDGYCDTAANLYGRYRQWAEANGEYVASQKRVGQQLAERGMVQDRDAQTRRTIWKGLRAVAVASETIAKPSEPYSENFFM